MIGKAMVGVLRKVATGVAVLGAIGFLPPFWLYPFPVEWVNRTELPNTLDAVRISAPDGRVFVASKPFGRVQRYGPAGFERGFSVGSLGGHFDIGVSAAGNILICSVRARELITYDRDGDEIEPRKPCTSISSNHGRIPPSNFYAHDAKVPLIAGNWVSALAVPLWHPLVAWLMLAAAGLYLEYGSREESKAP